MSDCIRNRKSKKMFRKKSFISKLFFLIFTIILLSEAGLFASDMVIPMVKTPFPVHGATWNKDGTIFAYTEENNIIVRDGNEYSLLQSIQTENGNLQFMEFTQVTKGSGDQLATLSDQNTMEIRILPDERPVNRAQVSLDSFPTAMAYNWNGNYLATADTGRSVYIYMQNYMTETLIERKSEILNQPAKSLSFSPDNKYLAVGSEDNQIYILDVSSGKVLYSMIYPSEMEVTPIFTKDSLGIIYPLKKKRIVITDFYGNVQRIIKAKKPVRSLTLAPDGDTLILNCTDNMFYFYSLETGKYQGYIPRYSQAQLTCYAFDNAGKKLLQGYGDGCIYILDVDDVFLLPGEKPPAFRLYVADDSTSLKGKNLDPKDLENRRGNRRPYFKGGHQLVFDTSFAVLPTPYMVAVSAGIGYKNYKWFKPFYVGAEVEPFIGFPTRNFPYLYKVGGGKIDSPLLIGMKVYAPVGFAMKPLSNDLEVFGEVLLGTSLCQLWDRQFGDSMITSKVFPSYYMAGKVGLGWKFISLSVRGEYDTILQFSFSADLGININLPGG